MTGCDKNIPVLDEGDPARDDAAARKKLKVVNEKKSGGEVVTRTEVRRGEGADQRHVVLRRTSSQR